jgi:pilus assembly protein CpaF
MSTVDMPLVAVRAQVAAAIHVVVCANRFHDGSRRITHISEVLPLDEKGDYRTQDIFVYSMTGKDEQGNVQGYHAPTGILPTFLHQLHTYGFEELTEDFFDPGSYGLEQPKVSAVHQFQVRWVERLQGGKEQWDAKPFDRNHLQKLEQGFALTLTERDLVPPPMADAQPRSEPATREPPQVPPATSPRQEPADPRLRTTEARRPTQPSEPQNESGSGRPASRASGQLLARQLERQKAQQRSEPRRPDRLGLGPRPRPTGSPSEPEDDA